MAKTTLTSGSSVFWSAIKTALNNMFTELYRDKADIGTLPPVATYHAPETGSLGVLGMDESQRLLRGGSSNTLQRSADGVTWETIYTFTRPVAGVRQLDNGELLVGLSDDYPTNSVKSSIWLSSNYASGTLSFIKVLDADDYQQNLDLMWGFGGAGEIYVVSEYDSKAYGARSAQQRVWLTVDSGVTWSAVYDHGTGSLSSNHVHGCCYDQYREAIWVSTGDLTGTSIIVSWDLGDTWETVTVKHQPTAIYAFPECVVFGTDSAPNGVLIIANPSPDNLVITATYRINQSSALTHVAARPYRLGNGYPLLIPYVTAVSGIGRVLASYDGFSWFELWKDSRSYTGKGPSAAFGPLVDGSYRITGRDDSGVFVAVVDDISTSLISGIARMAEHTYRQIPRRAFISLRNSSTPYLTIPPYTYVPIVFATTPPKLDDPSSLFSVEPDGSGVTVARPCVVHIDAIPPIIYSANKPHCYVTINGTKLIGSSFLLTVSATTKLSAGDTIGIEIYHATAGVDKTLEGSDYTLMLDAWEMLPA